ncbi:hypothetical protein GLAREA_07291 [Glarea lozoyensis ATCC 20868]|uniref:Uncharacterized protein n=1 Tax=Glarea lozoyensis (strain ATCC 20868 / MF5171) TaxID=1116229 RepID=S3E0V9_GLAL2|nr:uncharacterized protein GLAREA_07291 [Glarea lozoyensis ATCC 20868]EPE32158.1 hypothetical protein GLAREA_07291 [Glarea lozoyensis ATCC 20868]
MAADATAVSSSVEQGNKTDFRSSSPYPIGRRIPSESTSVLPNRTETMFAWFQIANTPVLVTKVAWIDIPARFTDHKLIFALLLSAIVTSEDLREVTTYFNIRRDAILR